jgi:SM-20-related protein
LLTLPPIGGTLVLFMSADMPHEVLAAHRSRYSIAGWFRQD